RRPRAHREGRARSGDRRRDRRGVRLLHEIAARPGGRGCGARRDPRALGEALSRVLSRWLRRWSPRILGPLAAALARLGISPNQATLAGLAAAWISGVLIVMDRPMLAGATILASGFLDALDGEIARASGRETALGAFLDSIADH